MALVDAFTRLQQRLYLLVADIRAALVEDLYNLGHESVIAFGVHEFSLHEGEESHKGVNA